MIFDGLKKRYRLTAQLLLDPTLDMPQIRDILEMNENVFGWITHEIYRINGITGNIRGKRERLIRLNLERKNARNS